MRESVALVRVSVYLVCGLRPGRGTRFSAKVDGEWGQLERRSDPLEAWQWAIVCLQPLALTYTLQFWGAKTELLVWTCAYLCPLSMLPRSVSEAVAF